MDGAEITGAHPPSPEEARAILERETLAIGERIGQAVEGAWRGVASESTRTGTYARSITHSVAAEHSPAGVTARITVGTNLFYAKFLEQGTGIYGPAGRRIVPRQARALRWPAGGYHRITAQGGTFIPGPGFTQAGRARSGRAGAAAQFIYARSIRGIQPRHYSQRAFVAAASLVDAIVADGERRLREALAA